MADEFQFSTSGRGRRHLGVVAVLQNRNTINPRRPHTVMLVNLDSQPVVVQSLSVRWFVDY
jgi:hypothetical protein